MRCYHCHRPTKVNALRDLDQEESDILTNYYGLIHLTGPDDMFEQDGWVVICNDCVLEAILQGHHENDGGKDVTG